MDTRRHARQFFCTRIGRPQTWRGHPKTAAAVLALTVAATGCRDRSGEQPQDDFDRAALLENLGENVILPTYTAFADDANALSEATKAWHDAVVAADGEPATSARDGARAAWRTAMATWQQAEVFQVGPAGPSGVRTGGQNMRDEIYSWPTVNPCLVDQGLVDKAYADADFAEATLVDARGLDALAYLLFNTAPANQCPPQLEMQTGWQSMSRTEKRRRRAAYAETVAADVATRADALVAAWAPEQQDFLGKLAAAGTDASPYTTAQTALDEILAGLFYVELTTKDAKLAVPAGLSSRCGSPPCPEYLESTWAQQSKENIIANLRALQRAHRGGDELDSGIGFDDFLTELGAPDVAEQMDTAISDSIAAMQGLNGSLEQALERDLDAVRDAHSVMREVTTILKGDFVTVLMLQVPQEGAGDSD